MTLAIDAFSIRLVQAGIRLGLDPAFGLHGDHTQKRHCDGPRISDNATTTGGER
jgi:hypothetical protein